MKLPKIKSKTFLNALIIILGSAVLISTILATIFSNISGECNYNVNILLINKTQQFIEKQHVLIERTWAIDRRNAFEAAGNTEEANAFKPFISQYYQEYAGFLRESKEEDDRISKIMATCTTKAKRLNWFLTLSIIISVLQFTFSYYYFKLYL